MVLKREMLSSFLNADITLHGNIWFAFSMAREESMFVTGKETSPVFVVLALTWVVFAGFRLLVWEWIHALCLPPLPIWECWTIWEEFSWAFCGWRIGSNSWMVRFLLHMHFLTRDSWIFGCIYCSTFFVWKDHFTLPFGAVKIWWCEKLNLENWLKGIIFKI